MNSYRKALGIGKKRESSSFDYIYVVFRQCLNCANGIALKVDNDFICLACGNKVPFSMFKTLGTEKNFQNNQKRMI